MKVDLILGRTSEFTIEEIDQTMPAHTLEELTEMALDFLGREYQGLGPKEEWGRIRRIMQTCVDEEEGILYAFLEGDERLAS